MRYYKMKKASIKGKLIFFLAIIIVIYLYRNDMLNMEMVGWKAKDTISGYVTSDKLSEDNGQVSLYLCPSDNCSAALYDAMSKATTSLHCAFFDLDLPEIITLLERKSQSVEVRLVVDDNNFEELAELDFVKQDTSSQYTHNKFCVIDDNLVTTGSFNPTYNGAYRNNNNLLVIESEKLAENYEDEFTELWNEEWGKGKRTKDPKVLLGDVKISSYFCPEDWCANRIIDELDKANSTVHFMTFSFTSEPIARKLIELHERNVTVTGVFEKQQNSKYSKFSQLNDSGIDVRWDMNKYKMHHKVFVIDSKTVVTGSMNPSKSGDTSNDENILIIEDESIAGRFLEEFDKI